ncbi:MAG: TIGR01777 family protein [Chitinophagaceae bacterium]|nr:TIGR01777 family protein [Oligoflexus sp.]
MKVLLTGGSGFIGRPLCVELTKHGHDLTLITRDPSRFQADWGLPSRFLTWDMEKEDCPESLESFDAIIHLAGESIAGGLWTPKQKAKILKSRIETTQALGRALAKRSTPLQCFISAAAIGIYPSSETAVFDESSPAGDGFLPEVCKAWEACVVALPKVAREVRCRFGLVIGQGGGFLEKLLLPSRLGAGTVLGDGSQWMSWVHRDDVLGIINEALVDVRFTGVINVVAPEVITQRAFQKELSHLLRRPLFLKVPKWTIKTIVQEFSHLVLDSQNVKNKTLQELGYVYRFPLLKDALTEALDLREKNGRTYFCHRLEAAQFVAKPVEEVFDFFCNPHNLERITPPLLSFKIDRISSENIGEGTVIDYKLKVHGIPMKWKTLIKKWAKNELFVDNQESGPYAIWHHTHRFFAVKGGTLMTDCVQYRLPLGMLGEGVALPFVQSDIRSIFRYRREIIRSEFGQADVNSSAQT